MRHGAALAGAALAAGALTLIAEPGSGATVEILSLVDAGCCSISDVSNPAGDLLEVNAIANDGFENAGDPLAPDAVALRASGQLDDISPEAVSSVAATETSVLTSLLITFADLRAKLSLSGQ
jgi:hypothetical protein